MDPRTTIIEVRRIPVQGGQVLEVEMTEKFIVQLRRHFDLYEGQLLEDDHIRMYVYGAFNNAVTKAEHDIEHVASAEGMH